MADKASPTDGTNINIINTTINHINLAFTLDPQSEFKWSDVTDLLSVPVPTQDTNHVNGNNNNIHNTSSNFDNTQEGFWEFIFKINKQIEKAAKAQAKAEEKSNKDKLGTARDEADCKEFFDDEKTLEIKIKKLAELVKKSQHFVAFTGAGISTAAGIADYRSGLNTVLDTGAGKWAKQAALRQGKCNEIKKPKRKIKSTFKAKPTASHMALVALMKEKPNYLKYLISQNTDGLHRRSGIPINQLSELHGNSTLEICKKCERQYMRDYRCYTRNKSVHDHKTGRFCTIPGCEGKLYDTIINFGEPVHEIPLQLARENTDKCDLMLCLGSSLIVSPAKDMPEGIGWESKYELENNPDEQPKHNLVIVNLQKTPLDEACSLRIFAKIDDVMIGLMKELDINIPKWYLEKFVKIRLQNDEVNDKNDDDGIINIKENDNGKKKGNKVLIVSGIDGEGIPATIFKDARLRNNGVEIEKMKMRKKFLKRFIADEYKFAVSGGLVMGQDEKKDADGDEDVDNSKGLVLELKFYGNYNEPNLFIGLNEYLDDLQKNGEIVLKMVMEPYKKIWKIGDKEEELKDENIFMINDEESCVKERKYRSMSI